VDTLRSAIIAERAGAARVELCANLYDGGTTPSAGLIDAVKSRVRVPVFVLIRPRGGGFVYSGDETEVMRRDVEVARDRGADGIVMGALDANGGVDVGITRALSTAARGLPVTFHRAFDSAHDLAESLDVLIDLGVARVLTSGGTDRALEGADCIARLVEQADDRITVMAGGGIREDNVREVIARTGVTEVHARISSVTRSAAHDSGRPVRLRKSLPEDETAWEELDEMRMHELVGLARA
jgi:copper homeostasis protein